MINGDKQKTMMTNGEWLIHGENWYNKEWKLSKLPRSRKFIEIKTSNQK